MEGIWAELLGPKESVAQRLTLRDTELEIKEADLPESTSKGACAKHQKNATDIARPTRLTGIGASQETKPST